MKTEPPQNQRSGDPMALSAFKNSLKMKPTSNSGPVIGGTDMLPLSVFGKGRERRAGERETMAMKTVCEDV